MAKKGDENPEKITPPHQIADLLQDINLGGLDGSGKSGLKSIVSQCLSSMLQLFIVTEPGDQIKMFDLDLYQHTVDGVKRNELKHKFEKDPYLKYIVDAIKHAVGADNETAQMEGNSSVSN